MIIDLDRHVGVHQLSELFPYMSVDWHRHFEREEWVAATGLVSSHIRVSDRFDYDLPEPFVSEEHTDRVSLLLPYQALTVAGWADTVAARAFVGAINECGIANWASPQGKLAIAISPHDPAWSAAEIRRRAAASNIGAVAVPLTSMMLGSSFWNPIYDACIETGLPLVAHFSGVEGSYLGAPALSGGVHHTAFSRLALMPHVAESNITSLAFEGTFARFPDLQILFSGFGFTWLPSLLWRMDREWRTFRHDVPWVKDPPSRWVSSNLWFTTWPLGEAAAVEDWQEGFPGSLRARIAFGSHAPHRADEADDAERVLGADMGNAVLMNGARFLSSASVGGVR